MCHFRLVLFTDFLTKTIFSIVFSQQRRKTNNTGFKSARFGSGNYPTARNIMAGVLLSPGPIAIADSVRKTSKTFLFSMSVSKFESAANKLQTMNLGTVVHLRSGKKTPVFIKKSPDDIAPILAAGGYEDLCSIGEYVERYMLPIPRSISQRTKYVETLVNMGVLVPEMLNAESVPDTLNVESSSSVDKFEETQE